MHTLFWAWTLIPGMALASLPALRLTRTGVLGALAWWFTLSLVAHTLLTVVAFALVLSVRTATIIAGAISVASLIIVWRRRRALRPARLAVDFRAPATWIALALIILTLPLPGATRFDAQMHAAKILLQQIDGFGLQDPFSPVQVAHSSFHVNVIHLLHGIGVFSTGATPLWFWQAAAPFFRLIEFGAVQLLGLHVFRSTFLASVMLIAAVPLIGLNPDNAVPASIAQYALLPVIFVTLSRYLHAPSRHSLARLALCGLVLPAVHVGHAVVYLLCLLPPLATGAIVEWRAHRPLTRWRTAALALVAPTIPFLVLTATFENHALEQMGRQLAWEISSFEAKGFSFETLSMRRQHWILPVSAAMALLVYLGGDVRARFSLGAASLFVALQFMFNPFVFRLASRALPFWMFRRASGFAAVAGFVAAGGLTWLCRSEVRRPQLRAAVAVVAAAAVIGFGAPLLVDRLRSVELDAVALVLGDEVQQVLASLPGRPLVAADPDLSLLVPAIRPAAVMAPSLMNTNPADSALMERGRARDEILSPDTPDERRLELVRRYSIDVLLVRRQDLEDGTVPPSGPLAVSERLVAYRPTAALPRR